MKTYERVREMSVAEYNAHKRADGTVDTAALEAFLPDARTVGAVALPPKPARDAVDRIFDRAASPGEVSTSTPVPDRKRAKGKRKQTSEASRKSASGGNRAEEIVTKLLVRCAERGVAWVTKNPTPTGVHRRRGARSGEAPGVFFSTRAGADYGGHLLNFDGRAVPVYIEAKKKLHGNLSLTRVKPQQREVLDRGVAHGCISLLVVILGPGCDVYAVPWALARLERTLKPADLAGWRIANDDPAFLSRWQR